MAARTASAPSQPSSEVAGAGARERDDGARVEAGGGGLGVGGEQGDQVGAARVEVVPRGQVLRGRGDQLEGAAEQVVERVVGVEAAGGVAGLALAQGGPQQHQRGRGEAEPRQQARAGSGLQRLRRMARATAVSSRPSGSATR
jgi:hypothetical protein